MDAPGLVDIHKYQELIVEDMAELIEETGR